MKEIPWQDALRCDLIEELLPKVLPLPELRTRGDVTEAARRCAERADFASCIREGRPFPPGR